MNDFHNITRRGSLLGAAGAVLLGAHSAFAVEASSGAPTQSVRTTSGRVRGMRSEGVSSFKGIRYGADTSAYRFQPSAPAPGWRGVRDCFEYGAQSPQGRFAFNPPLTARTDAPPESEDCLFLNVFTPDASRARKRPVMVWLHGGGFITGSGSSPRYDGGALCRRGDVVVVTLNHRLAAVGYLYLGELHADFADSGNAGQFDQILALEWVRDNIEQFGGDPSNVTIFGQSGGGMKIGALMAAPRAHGLFHKAIMQSGPGYALVEKDHAAGVAERTLAELGVPRTQPHALLRLDAVAINEAMSKTAPVRPNVVDELFAGLKLSGDIRHDNTGAVVDGRLISEHPYFPSASAISSNIPLLLGSTEYDAARYVATVPGFDTMSPDQARERFVYMLGDSGRDAFEIYRALRPAETPNYWLAKCASDMGMWTRNVRIAERKAAQNAAPVFLYRNDYAFGPYRNPHASDIVLVFGHPERAPDLVGAGAPPQAVAAAMSQAWLNFAHAGDPSQPGSAWPRYDTGSRGTMLFNVESRVVSDPDAAARQFFATQPLDSWVEAA